MPRTASHQHPKKGISVISTSLRSVLLRIVLAVPMALFMSYAALEHNPQEEFCTYISANSAAMYLYSSGGEFCEIKWWPVIQISLSWLLIQFLVIAFIQSLWANHVAHQTE
jgi:hypothetical protein